MPVQGDSASELKRLRELVARLTGENHTLRRELMALERERFAFTLGDIGAALARAADLAERAMDEELLDSRYVVAGLEATLRGTVTVSGGTLVVQPPRLEGANQPAGLGTLRLNLGRIPAAPTGAETLGNDTDALTSALLDAQAAFSRSLSPRDEQAVGEMLGLLTQILSWGREAVPSELLAALGQLARSARRIADGLAVANQPETYQASVEQLISEIDTISKGGHLTSPAANRLSRALKNLANAYRDLMYADDPS